MSTAHSERLGVDVHFGKQPATGLRAGTWEYAELRKGLAAQGLLPQVPATFGHGHDFAQGKWLMLGNGPDPTVSPGFGGCGDCAWAAPAHEEMENASNAGRPIPPFSGLTIVKQYSAYSGYNIQTGANDNGSNIQDVLEWRQTKGLLDDNGVAYKIGATVAGEPGNLTHLSEIAYFFESADIGIVVTQAQMDQFDASATPIWDYVAGSPQIGGHCITVAGRNQGLSWAELVGLADSFIEHQNDETYGYVDNERYNAVTGETAEGYRDQDLEKFLTMVAQAKAA